MGTSEGGTEEQRRYISTMWGNVGECRGKCSQSTVDDGEWNRDCADQRD